MDACVLSREVGFFGVVGWPMWRFFFMHGKGRGGGRAKVEGEERAKGRWWW